MRLLVSLMLFLLPSSVWAEGEALDYTDFKHVPILHDGRMKPLDTFARVQLDRLHGNSSVEGMSAIEWLAETIFRPDVAVKKRIIHIEDDRLLATLKLPEAKGKLYSFDEVATAYEKQRQVIIALIQKGEENLNKQEQEFLDLYSVVNDFSHTTRALTLVLPSKQQLPEAYKDDIGEVGGGLTYLDLLRIKDKVVADATAAVKKHGKNLKRYSDTEQQAAMLAFYFANIEATGEENTLFRVMPSYLQHGDEWFSPWELLNEGHGSPQGSELLDMWKRLAAAYYNQDNEQWQSLSQSIKVHTAGVRTTTNWQLDLEVLYHQLNPTIWVMACYGLAFLLLLASMIFKRLPASPALWLLAAGVLAHTGMIVARIAILERPPVSTLYESVLFVSLIAVLLGLWLDRRTNTHEGKLIASLLGAGLLGLSGTFTGGGDTLGVVIAVLNTNFWLATHVICITIGYGCALVAGSLAHIYLAGRSDKIGKQLQTAALIALLFTAIGTILGGIWADQSWGRFWGWDPKENGALAIVLWLVWVLHGRITGYLKLIGFASLLALTNIVVALSWFGVNLLSVGLHSYGFTDSAALGLGAFCMAELVIIALLTIRAKQQERQLHAV